MPRRALIIGIDDYDIVHKLNASVTDALAIKEVLARHENGEPNYACQIVTSPGPPKITRAFLRNKWNELFRNFDGDVLFYFAGHGTPTETGGYIVTQEGTPEDPGLAMNDLIILANQSKARSILLILDCCHAGDLGNTPGTGDTKTQLREGLTILAASRATQQAAEFRGGGVFTDLLIGALEGGAADVQGRVSAAGIYAYVEKALGPWEQRPLYKSHAARLEPVRLCNPSVEDSLLRELPVLFEEGPDSVCRMAPSYEKTDRKARPEHVAIFDKFKILRNARLLTTEAGEDLFDIALESKTVNLTPLGRFYWHLAKQDRI